MFKRNILLSLSLVLCILAVKLSAQEQSQSGATELVPPIGPPPQMKEIAFLVGTWDVDMKMKMSDTASTFISSKGTCRYESILNGAVMQMAYGGEFMGMNFMGFGLQCFNRETGKWQMVWSDNMSACVSIYEGDKKDGATVVTGKDRYQGMVFLTRITAFNETPTRFEWKMENSMDEGKSFITTATAVYTKKN